MSWPESRWRRRCTTPKEGAAEVLYGLGGAGTRQGDELAALIYLRLALILRPDHDLAAITVATLFEDMKQGDSSIRAYQLVPASSPMRESAEIQIALELDALGRTDDAMTRLQALVAAHPQDPEAWSALGSLQRSAKNFDAAAQSYDKAIELVGTPDKAIGRCSISAASASSVRSSGRKPRRISRERWSCFPNSRWCSIISAILGR